jgi:predicted RNA-binding protein associated with RNAse of E/G family
VTPTRVLIHYRRLPDRVRVYEQRLLLDAPDVKVTFQPATPLEGPLEVDGHTVLEPRSPVVWFTFPGRWHDIGRFHTADGVFTGLYANVLTPPEFVATSAGEHRWDTTDLFLDVWLDGDGRLQVLDRDQFDDARARGWMSDTLARQALAEVDRIRAAHEAGDWPPAIVAGWTLERVLGET